MMQMLEKSINQCAKRGARRADSPASGARDRAGRGIPRGLPQHLLCPLKFHTLIAPQLTIKCHADKPVKRNTAAGTREMPHDRGWTKIGRPDSSSRCFAIFRPRCRASWKNLHCLSSWSSPVSMITIVIWGDAKAEGMFIVGCYTHDTH
jgi:hypothetical protein